MESVPLVEVELVFQLGVDHRLEPYADGFALVADVESAAGGLRHWACGVGWLGTTSDNEVRHVTVHGCRDGVVSLPANGMVEVAGSQVAAQLGWPVEGVAWMERDERVARYELVLTRADVANWVRLGSVEAWIGASEVGELCRVVCVGLLPASQRVAVRLPGERYAASLQAGGLFRVDVEAAGVDGWRRRAADQVGHESARGNAWLELSDGGFESLVVYDEVPVGEAAVFDRDAPEAAQFEGWQAWPADVRAMQRRENDRTVVHVRFGTAAAEGWVRLGDDVWVGSTAQGEITGLVFADIEESSGRGTRLDDGDWDAEPGDLARHRELVEQASSLRFVIYGLVGELGAPEGFGIGWGGIPSSLAVMFGSEESDRWLVVTSTREADLGLARSNLTAALVPPGGGPDDHSREAVESYFAEERDRHDQVEAELLATGWEPIIIPVDGVALEFRSITYGDRWAALCRIAYTTITLLGQGYSRGEVALATIADIAPHVDHARRRERERIKRRLADAGMSWEQYQARRSPKNRVEKAAVRRVIDDLTDALHRNAGFPDLASLFTNRVVQTWGGPDRYSQLLLLHTMLRPITGTGTSGDYPKFRDDGSADMRISLTHAAVRGSGSFVLRATATTGEDAPEPEPDRQAIRCGEEHHITFHVIKQNDQWRIDTDLLSILIDRLGTIAEVVQPLSQQTDP